MAEREQAKQVQEHGPGGAEESPHRLEQQRRENREAIGALGVDPYGGRVEGLITLAEARGRHCAEADAAWAGVAEAKKAEPTPSPLPQGGGRDDPRALVKVAGRVVLKRDGGKLIWMQLRDHTTGPRREGGEAEQEEPTPNPLPQGGGSLAPDLQIAVSKKDVAAPGFEVAKLLDLGDLVVVEGRVMKTKAGEVTVWASGVEIAAKSIAPPPEKWKGLQDIEQRYRRRYVDLYANPEAMRVFMLRSMLVGVIRRFLEGRGFIEVETPVLQVQAGGAAARPFITHINALDIDLYMRIAPELYLKRLLVGGMPRVFEWSRNFRNEGVDKTHNPEFTMIELYEAFGDYGTMRELTESLVRECARRVAAEMSKSANEQMSKSDAALRLPFGEIEVDYGAPFEVVEYGHLFRRAFGFEMMDADRVRAEAKKRGLPLVGKTGAPLDPILLVNELFDIAEEAIDPGKPTFVIDYPAPLCPLTRAKRGRPEVAERFELFIGGMEMANAYTELNDPDVQEARFREQLSGIGDEEATFRNLDEDFIQALKVGMPPAGGLGIGIDRLMMVLLNQRTIRDVILFPLMRPEPAAG